MAAPSGSGNPAHGAFIIHLDALKTAVTDPGGLATALYSRGLIDRLAFQRARLTSLAPLEQSQELLSALDGKIAASEAAFDEFLELISTNPVMEDICSLLCETRDVLSVVDDDEVKSKQNKEQREGEEEREEQSEENDETPPGSSHSDPAETESPGENNERSGSSDASAPSSSAVAVARRGSSYREHCEESFREWKANVAEFVENTTMSDVAEVLEEEKVLDKLKGAILDFL